MMTLERLKEIQQRSLAEMALRRGESSQSSLQYEVLVCRDTGCSSSKGDQIMDRLRSLVARDGLEDQIRIQRTGCFGFCAVGPIVVVYPGGIFYSRMKLEDVDRLYEEHLKGGMPVSDLIHPENILEDRYLPYHEAPFYRLQKKIVLRNAGRINPESLDEYIAMDGYQALYKVLTTMTPDEVIAEVQASGLRGRGGAGFPTGLKWKYTREAPGEKKYVVCNADEGDPGAFMDRSVLEGDPHSVIEAMIINGYAVGADEGYIYIRAEYPGAVHRLNEAIAAAKAYGLLGEHLFGTDFSFNLSLRLGAGAFVCGEGTALVQSIEGKRGMPRVKPPRMAQKGLWLKPTVLNNVETYANIAPILLKGPDWFRSIGTQDSPGTKVFALGGNINNVGLVEVPMGTTLRQMIYDIGGGIPHGREFKAVQTGGPSGGCITAEHFDTPIDFDNLHAIGSMMGSGGMIVMDDHTCMVDVARFYMDFIVEESCGKCTPCREGTKRMLEILEKITEGEASLEDLDHLKDLADTVAHASLCGLGESAPNPVFSTIANFPDEYLAHIKDHQCPAGVCTNLTEYFINDTCIGCTKCARNCPVSCIQGAVKERHVIDAAQCIKCGTCEEVCPVSAVVRR
ncbi:NAD-reducing hydrogenase subunit HoxF [Clostridiaceae bacterium JG1575]|nr:NAD-reducing hydrogenase subunit HoxF [Clostridiaceae bacterium JG1575]